MYIYMYIYIYILYVYVCIYIVPFKIENLELFVNYYN